MSDTKPGSNAPRDDDARFDDFEFNPAIEPKKAKAWLNLLEESEGAFEQWNDHCDRIEKLYANLERLAARARDKEFQMFWANCEVIKPAIYATPPEPVVVPKFKDRRPVYDAASEFLERCCTVSFDLTRIQDLMLLVRDDVALIGRGVPWCRYESGKDSGSYYDSERVCVDFLNRRDFLHSISRNWREVTWVAAAGYLTRSEARDRFYKYSGDAYQQAEYKVDRDTREVGGADNRERAKFWEIWSKTERRVVWVAKGCEDILDEDDPHLDLSSYFPCPCPAYATTQPNSLVPVPDVMQYKDQLDELNLLTGRIHALSDALEAKGFYPAGGAELGDAVQAAIRAKTPGRMLVPISNWAAFGGSKEVIIWLPIAEIASTIQTCIAVRKEIIQDIYQIMGLSDIMRGATDPGETLGAQQLKTQYGSTRVRDKQMEMERVARDLVCITAEIITEKFDPVTMIEMSQTQLPTREMQRMQVEQLQAQLQQQQQMLQMAQQNPQIQQAMQQNPQAGQMMEQGQEAIKAGQEAIAKVMAKPTVEQVLTFLRNNRARSFVLDIETDSTIQMDENAEKQRRSEFIGVLAQLLPQLTQMINVAPDTAVFCGEVLKFATAPFRAGRSLSGSIDDFVDKMTEKASAPRGDDPATAQNKAALQIEQMKDAREREKNKTDAALQTAELKMKDEHAKMKLAAEREYDMAKLKQEQEGKFIDVSKANQQAMQDREKHQANMIEIGADIQAARQKADMTQQIAMSRRADMAARADERRAAAQFRMSQQAQRRPPGGGGFAS